MKTLMKPKHKPALAGDSQKQTTPLSLVEDTLTETNDVGASENPAQPDTDVNLNSEPAADANEFERLDAVVQRGLRSFVEVGLALGEIRQRALWKAGGYSSWTAYCAMAGGLTRIHANRLIRGAKTARDLSQVKPNGFTLGATTPRSEGQVRPLGVLKTNEDRNAAWSKAVELAGGQPTEKIVQSVVDEMRNPNGKIGQKTNWKDELIDFIGRLRDALIEEQPRVEIENLIAELETNLKI